MSALRDSVLALPGLVSFWDFQQPAGQQRLAHGQGAYALHEEGGTIERVEGGIFGAYAAHFTPGHWLECPRRACPLLNLHGEHAELTLVAWLRRGESGKRQRETVAGIWHASEHRRQYGLILTAGSDGATMATTQIACGASQAPGQRSACETAHGASALAPGAWHQVASTYGPGDGGAQQARLYLDGQLDHRQGHNPAPAPGGIFNGGAGGADFTVGAMHCAGEVGDWFAGTLAGLAICSRALDPATIATLHQNVPLPG